MKSEMKLDQVLERRNFLKGVAAVGAAGLTGAAASPAAAQASGARTSTAAANRVVRASDSDTVADTTSGKIRGFWRNGVYIFKGVPYGASTAGKNRFMPPAKPEPWSGIRNALQFGPTCPVKDSAHANTDFKNSAGNDEDAFLLHRGPAVMVPGEDCLRLNLWTPEIHGSQGGTGKRPVMVYMHGGGFANGCGHDLLAYEGESLARNHDAVVVNHNHRLNVHGYLDLSAYGEEFASSANVGMLDLVAVLEWVRDNIANFGGDPGNVTIFGQSGGGGKVLALMAMPSAKGLFHKAITQSGPYLRFLSPEYSQKVAELTLQELGLSRAQVKQLQTISPDKLLGAATEAQKKMPKPTSPLRDSFGVTGWAPTVDGRILPRHPFDPDAPAISADVPMMTGCILNEFVNSVDHPELLAMSAEEAHKRVAESFGSRAAEIVAAYREEYPKATPFQLYATIATSRVRLACIEQAARKSAQGAAPAYSYIYAWRTPMLNDRAGTFHGSELAFVFDNGEICDHYSGGRPEALALSRRMGAAWVSFARTGNPNHKDLTHWPAYTATDRATMIFDTPCVVRKDPEGKGLNLIRQAIANWS